MSSELSLLPGDLLKVERRYVVDGVVTKVTDKGVFAGVKLVGSAEHLVLETPKRKGVRLLPLSAVSEITLVKPMPREAKHTTPSGAGAWDPSFA